MKTQKKNKEWLKTFFGFLVVCAIGAVSVWLGRLVLTVGSIIIGVSVGLIVWLLSDFQTGFYSGFLAWILGWLSLFVMGILLDIALEFLVEAKDASPDPEEFEKRTVA